MDKCHGCFSEGWITCFAEALGIDQKDCHLTEVEQRIIRNLIEREQSADILRFMEAASRGVFDCGHCRKFHGCASTRNEVPPNIRALMQSWWPCEDYKERKEDDDEV